MASAYDLDYDTLMDPDPARHRPERQRLQQALVDHVSGVVDHDPAVEAARENWRTSVNSFESRHNSVVAAAANDGRINNNLSFRNGGLSLVLPEDFEVNLLSIDEVTSVGAVTTVAGEVRVAGYTSLSEHNAFFADGDLGSDAGTSFAAPRGAKTMTGLHCQNRHLNSDEVEQLLVDSLTESIEVEPGQAIAVLQEAPTQTFAHWAGRTTVN